MYNYNAEQIFVVHPRNSGGGILSFILSLDPLTPDLSFKKTSTQEKINLWKKHLDSFEKDAHLFNFINYNSPRYYYNINNTADFCHRYIQKCHFFELDSNKGEKNFLDCLNGKKRCIGIYLTDSCVDKLLSLRPQTSQTPDFYQKFIYSNLKKLLPTFYNINVEHVLSFQELLNLDVFLDHLNYCNEIFDLNINIDYARGVMLDWYKIIGGSNES